MALINNLGASLGQIDGKLQSLVTYCGDRPRITVADVAKLTSGDQVKTIWELIGATFGRRPDAALLSLEALLVEGEEALKIVTMLARELRIIHTVNRMTRERMSEGQIASATGMQSWMVLRAQAAGKSLTDADLRRRLHWLVEADMALKSSGAKDRWILEQLVLKMCGIS